MGKHKGFFSEVASWADFELFSMDDFVAVLIALHAINAADDKFWG